jgi:hypothetical protein
LAPPCSAIPADSTQPRRDGFGIRGVIFIAVNVRLNELRRDEFHHMSKLCELARPEMRTAASLHPNQARRQLIEKRIHLRAFQLFAQCNFASRIDWFEWLLDTSTLAQLMPLKAGASMPLLWHIDAV